MNNYYSLIYLKREIKEKIVGGQFCFSISPHKDVLHIYIAKDEQKKRLIFSSNPRETALFCDSYRPPKKNNVLNFFSSLEGTDIIDVELAHQDRLLSVYFEDQRRLVFKLFSGGPNVFLVDEEDQITDAFKNVDEVKGEPAPTPESPEFKDEVSPRRNAKNQMTEVNPLLPRNLLPYVIEQHDVDKMSPEKVKTFTKKLTAALRNDPQPRVLTTGDFCLWSEKWLDIPSQKECNTVNNCVKFAYKEAVHLRRLHQKREEVTEFLEQQRDKKSALIDNLEQAHKRLERSERYEKYGHLLMAHAHESLDPGTEELCVPDFYDEDNEICIPLKEQKDIPENAEYYYDKAEDAKKSYKKAKQRLPKVKEELHAIERLLSEITDIEHLPQLRDWIKDERDQLKKFGYGSNDQKQARSPFRKFKEGKFEIWIGKNAKSNDKLTSHAHKEDIWLHARGVGGSHTVIRMGNRKDYPPQNVLLKAAGYAAYHSKARGMKSAPVIYTKRKYVYKPSGADPGAVVVKKEQVQMVPPVNPKKT